MKRKRASSQHRHQHGFTLVEMAIVLMIISLLIGGLFAPLSGQIDAAKINETRRIMETVREALIGFALTHGRLPCPAQANLATGTAQAGSEAYANPSCTCKGSSGGDEKIAWVGGVACTGTSITGVIPWASLGMDESDAWGRRFTYRVTHEFANAPSGMTSTFTLADSGNLEISTEGTVITAPAVIVSHGKNGLGAYMNNGLELPAASGDEAENTDNDINFIQRDQAPDFDDLVTWVSPNILKNRLVTVGKLP